MTKPRGFFQCYNHVIQSPDLTPDEKIVLCVFLSYNISKTDIEKSYEDIMKDCGLKRTKTYHAIKGLRDKLFISVEKTSFKNRNKYKVLNKAVVQYMNNTSSVVQNMNYSPSSSSENDGSVVQYLNSKDNIKTNIKEINKEKIPYRKIIDYLNEKTGKNFKAVDKTKTLISARWNEKHSLEDFIRVIDICCAKSKAGSFDSIYLRPSTLFNGKFNERTQWEMPSTQPEPPPYKRL